MDLIINTMYRNTDGDVISTIHWIAKKLSDGYEASTYGSVNLQEKSPSDPSFVSYKDITQNLAIEWLKDALGTEKIAAIETELDVLISALKSPKTASGLPWQV